MRLKDFPKSSSVKCFERYLNQIKKAFKTDKAELKASEV